MVTEAFYDEPTSTLTYLVYDEETLDAVLIDPVLDFDSRRVCTSTESVDAIIARARLLGLTVHFVLDTHAHADHLSAFVRAKDELDAQTGIGAQIDTVQQAFKPIFNLPEGFRTDGSQWDILVEDGVPLQAGTLRIEPMHSPGHTPACFVYRIGDALFTGDVLFMPDFGTGRCDFPGGSAEQLYDSIMRLYALPDDTRVYVGHDYQPGGRDLAYETTIGECKRSNVHLDANTSKEAFVRFRTERDKTLAPPQLIFQSLQVNAAAGELPHPDSNGLRYFRMPMGVF